MIRRLLLIAFIVSAGCSKQGFSPAYKVPAEFEPYVTGFISEAAARGHQLTINNLVIRYDSTLAMDICAKTNVITTANDVQKIISINPILHCWQNDQMLETLIFHELGHCILGRQHDDSLMPKGYPKSIMVAKDITIYSPCLYNIGDPNCDKRSRRTYYIDELFDPSTPIPDWGK